MKTLAVWHDIVRNRDSGRLGEVLAEDCVFLSPIMHTPQAGGALTQMYLTAALNVFNDSFQYVKEVVSDQYAVLEFTCEVDGILVNGVDIMTFNAAGQIVEFKVMVRPLKAVNLLHARMRAMLEEMSGN
ncbi:MAG: nuclear transport factor 2 family protein [Haliea sp.]|jgi:hypothetical protein|nr:nuclear transport factor 2 family protein [Haliea sp.]MBK6739759.1 nuclear transport factor 2 family protein [Haliea sp.]